MKIREIIKALMLFILVLPSYADAANLGELRLSLIDGDVQIRTEDANEWLPAIINMPLRDGDSIWVPEGARTEIQARNGTAVRLNERSSLDILTVDNDSLQFYLGMGQAYLNFRGQKRNSIIQLDTPVSSIRVYDPAKFAVVVSENGDTDISVFRGRVYAEGRSGRTQVSAGKVLYLTDDYADLYPLGRPDAWEEWNKERDRTFDEIGYSSRYLPDELDVYSGDLDNNGRWVYTGLYGYVWTPTVHISIGWSPYRNGRWVWIGGDYVWIAYEPWGWVPYHYGRWSFIASFGWCWVPPSRGDVYWGPGYVGWVSTPTYVAWVPLAPEDVYYGHGHYGRHSVNIVNVNINKIVVKNVYKNTYVNNGVTVVHRDTFLKGKREDFKLRDNPFLKERISIGRPGIAPERATRMPVIKDIPKAKEPPRIVREIKVRELKGKRRLVREPDRSVFKPGSSTRTMPVRDIKKPKTGDTIRTPEPKEKTDKRRLQKIETKQPDRTAPGKGKELQAPAEKKTGQPKDTTTPPVIKYRQTEQPVIKQERQLRRDEGGTDKEQKEMKTPAKQKEKLQAPPKERVVQPKESKPQPVIKKKYRQPEQPVTGPEKQSGRVEEKTGQDNKRTGAPLTKSSSEKQGPAVSPDSGKKQEKKKVTKPSRKQEEEAGQDYNVPERTGR
jgi:hypothetical protein